MSTSNVVSHGHQTETAQALSSGHVSTGSAAVCAQEEQHRSHKQDAVQTSMVLLARESASCARPPRLVAGENTNARTLCLLRTTCIDVASQLVAVFATSSSRGGHHNSTQLRLQHGPAAPTDLVLHHLIANG